MCFCTCFFNLNVVVTGFLVNYRLGQRLVTLPNLSCNAVSLFSHSQNIKYFLTKWLNYFIFKLTIMLMVWEASVTIIMGCGNCLRSIFSLILKSKNLNKSNLLQYYPHLCGSLRRLGPWLEHQEASQVLWPHHHHPCSFLVGWRHLHGMNHTQSLCNHMKSSFAEGKGWWTRNNHFR